jgi:malonyl-CoA/methylmalonyl-CoA synthetase
VLFEQRTGHRILERYGMTETNMNTSNPYDGERRAGTVGFPLPGVDLRIVDAESGKVLPQGEIGIIEVKGPNVFSGYWQMPEKTKEEFREDGFFITGDVGVIDADGYVQIVGRSKDLIISGGYNIYPKELELLLDEEEGVLESAVIGVPHADFGEGVVAVLVPRPGARLEEEVMASKASSRRSPASSSPSASWCLMNCRATPWARFRKTSCATPTRRCSLAEPEIFPAVRLCTGRRTGCDRHYCC